MFQGPPTCHTPANPRKPTMSAQFTNPGPLVEVEKIHPPLFGRQPRPAAGRLRGAQGYRAMLHALRAREGSLYQELLDGCHGLDDPAAFELAAVNDQLAERFPTSLHAGATQVRL
jgi:hypothetical protein